MGDRTTVTLHVPKEYAGDATRLIGNGYWVKSEEDDFAYIVYEEINYGELPNLPLLIKAGIPYTYSWSSGCEYGEGAEYGRFTPEGEPDVKSFCDSKTAIDVERLHRLINKPEELIALICKEKAKYEVLPWDNQVEYGKLYRTKQLITGNSIC